MVLKYSSPLGPWKLIVLSGVVAGPSLRPSPNRGEVACERAHAAAQHRAARGEKERAGGGVCLGWVWLSFDSFAFGSEKCSGSASEECPAETGSQRAYIFGSLDVTSECLVYP